MVEYIELKKEDNNKPQPLVIEGKDYITVHKLVLRITIGLFFILGFIFGAWLL